MKNLIFIISQIVFFSLFSLFLAIAQITNTPTHALSIQQDYNLNPDWDWRIGDIAGRIYPDAAYKIYHRNDNGVVVESVVESPWTQANAWSGLLDNKKEDGWKLLARDFGTPTRSLSGINFRGAAYFVLYNQYRSIIRFFVCVKSQKEWKKGYVELQFYDQQNKLKTPGVLGYFKPLTEAMDNFENMKNNVTSVFSDVVRNDNWLWADFPISFDPFIRPVNDLDPPAFYFRIYGQDEHNISLRGLAQGTQGNISHVNNWLTGATYDNGSMGLANFKMPNLNIDPNIKSIELNGLNIKPFGTQSNWRSFTNYFSKIGSFLPKVEYGSAFKGLFDGFSSNIGSFVNALPISIPGLDIGGIFDFFVTGGAKSSIPAEPAPSFLAMNLELSGSIVTTVPLHEIRVTIPNTREEYWNPSLGSAVGIVTNEPLGLLTLLKTPVIHKKVYQRRYEYPHYDEYISYNIDFAEYVIADDLQIAYNTSNTNLEVVKTDVSLVVDYSKVDVNSNNEFVSWINSGLQEHLIEFEAPITSDRIAVRSLPVPINMAKNRAISMPTGYEGNHRLKIKAVFIRKDEPLSQPVVLISTYNVRVVDVEDLNVEQAMPTIPPQNVRCVIPTSGGVRISWDRNPESNIKLYFVERSINGSAFVIIGTTQDTVIVDNEVHKSVKPYLTYRQNVNVQYRVKAKSEWMVNYFNTKSQFSNYSDNISISGSIIAAFGKLGVEQVTPGSYSLSQNFPNPFNPSTTIYYGVKENGLVSIKVFNALGQEVATLVNERKEVGYHYAEWNAAGMPSGMYLYRISVGDFTETKKMTLMK